MRITISGTRSTGHRTKAEYHRLFRRYLAPFATPEAEFFIGGAVGIDTLTLCWLNTHSESGLTVVVPCTVDQQPAEAREAINAVRQAGRLARLVELRQAETPSADAYHARNRWMVDRSDFVAAFPLSDDGSGGSGTWQTLNYAGNQGLPRLIVPV